MNICKIFDIVKLPYLSDKVVWKVECEEKNMLLSERYKFLFQKTKKTGSTSLELAIAPYMGPVDIITPVSELTLFGGIRGFEITTEEDFRSDLDAVPPQNYRGNLFGETYRGVRQYIHFNKARVRVMLRNNTYPDQPKYTAKLKRRFLFHEHMPFDETISAVGEKKLSNFLKVAVIRDPIEQAISDYYDQLMRPENISFTSFDQYLDYRVNLFFDKNWKKFTSADQVQVDKFILYENFTQDILNFCKLTGLSGEKVLNNMQKVKVHSFRDREKETFQPSASQIKRIIDAAKKFYDLRDRSDFNSYLLSNG